MEYTEEQLKMIEELARQLTPATQIGCLLDID